VTLHPYHALVHTSSTDILVCDPREAMLASIQLTGEKMRDFVAEKIYDGDVGVTDCSRREEDFIACA